MLKIAQRLLLPLGLGLSLWFLALGFVLVGGQSKAQPPPVSAMAINRPQDPVIVTGAKLPAHGGAPVNELVLYAYQAGIWTPIPFQIDERTNDITGTYVTSDDGRLDANDELIFMAADAGDSVTNNSDWPNDAASRSYLRHAIRVSDPLNSGSEAWAYLYRSPTLTRSNTSYITWNQPAQIMTAATYIAAFNPTSFLGLADLKLNGNPTDVVDRQKIRAKPPFFAAFTEESLKAFIPATITLSVVGPIRAVRNDSALNLTLYSSRLDFDVLFDLSVLGGISLQFIRNSLDLNPAMSGSTYFDSNATTATIDGANDTVPTTPRIDWYQVISGAGPGGFVVTLPSINASGGTISNYYKDDSAVDAADTGDQRSFGDTGLLINAPGQIIQFTQVAYILPAGTTTNVGATYFNQAKNPLSTNIIAQGFGLNLATFLPAILKN
ncbi:MAG: hypothetical protein HYR94_12080 [Chloroflexi bacterium]|nr:hypothetical protein [Chloroflexota bacterium]